MSGAEACQAARQKMAEAQEAGNHRLLRQTQQQLQQTQQEVVGRPERDVEALLPEAARAAQVQAITLDAARTAEGVNARGVLPPQIAKRLIAGAEGEFEERRRKAPAFPGE